ncbi:hypothetical protein KXS07_07805 [Inquilinus limosus]|uniref:MAE_28990/MAE_18760 family HEPN-like nuclease n=1 Tax=Inquilinus limosus TaxID=171674 RepID=UPI003F17F52C
MKRSLPNPRVRSQLIEAIETSATWRRNELASIAVVLQRSEERYSKAVAKAGIVISYSHFEGFVKDSLILFGRYLTNAKTPRSALQNGIAVWPARAMLRDAFDSNVSHLNKVWTSYISTPHEFFCHDFEPYCETIGNINSEILKDQLSFFGANHDYVDKRSNFIDSQLLRTRNALAHGVANDFEMVIDKKSAMNIIIEARSLIEDTHICIWMALEEEKFKATPSK